MGNSITVIEENDSYRIVEDVVFIYGNKVDEDIKTDVYYKVQHKLPFMGIWITVKQYDTLFYDNDADFCRDEAFDLFNMLIKK